MQNLIEEAASINKEAFNPQEEAEEAGKKLCTFCNKKATTYLCEDHGSTWHSGPVMVKIPCCKACREAWYPLEDCLVH